MATKENKSPKHKENNREWILINCLLDAQQQTTQAMEQLTLSALTPHEGLSAIEVQTTLKQARRNHERAIEDLDAALAALSDDSISDPYEE
jgi:hypothetical protein